MRGRRVVWEVFLVAEGGVRNLDAGFRLQIGGD